MEACSYEKNEKKWMKRLEKANQRDSKEKRWLLTLDLKPLDHRSISASSDEHPPKHYLQKRGKLVSFGLLAKGSREAANESPSAPHIRFCSLSNISKQQLKAPAQTGYQYSMQDCMVVLQRWGNLRRQKRHRTNQSSNFLGRSFSNIDNVRAPIQLRRERKSQHIKRMIK